MVFKEKQGFSKQGDQMSLLKNTKNVAQPLFVKMSA
jgi:hypothetical protein